MNVQNIIVLIEENLLNNCSDHYSQWETIVNGEGNFHIAKTIPMPSKLPATEIRSRIIRIVRQLKKQKVNVKGIQVFGKDIKPFYFYLEYKGINYVFQTDACFGNWPSPDGENKTWEDLNLDRWLSIDEFPSDYQQHAWIARWGGINVKNESESELFRRFISRRSHDQGRIRG